MAKKKKKKSHLKTWKMKNAHCRTWNMVRKMKNMKKCKM